MWPAGSFIPAPTAGWREFQAFEEHGEKRIKTEMTVLDLSKANDFPSRIALLQTATQRIATHEARASGPCSRPNPPCGPKDCFPDPVEVTPTRVARNVRICERSDSPCASRSSGSSAGKVRSVQRELCAACRIGQVRQASASRQAQWCGCDAFCVGFPLNKTPKQMGQSEPEREASARPGDRHGGQARFARARDFSSPSSPEAKCFGTKVVADSGTWCGRSGKGTSIA
jgi:hypothetical protein